MNRSRWPWLLAALLAMIALGTLAGRTFYGERSRRIYELAGATMGTTWHLRLSLPEGSPEAWVAAIGDTVQSRLDRVESLMSTWDSTSELSRFNRSADTVAIPLSPETLEVVGIALDVSRASGGALDVTVGPLVAVWGFGPDTMMRGEIAAPPAGELSRLRSGVGMALLRVDRREGTVGKAHPGVQMDLSAVAKGYALDRAAEGVERMGGSAYALEVGGEVRARGFRPGGDAWRVAVEAPIPGERFIFRVIELHDEAVATSGDYRNFLDVEGRKLSHIIDPRTGAPVPWKGFSVSVVHPEAARADAWATALSVLGPDEGLALADRLGISALFVLPAPDGGFEERHSAGFEDRLEP